jgi:hypothetical protein
VAKNVHFQKKEEVRAGDQVVFVCRSIEMPGTKFTILNMDTEILQGAESHRVQEAAICTPPSVLCLDRPL